MNFVNMLMTHTVTYLIIPAVNVHTRSAYALFVFVLPYGEIKVYTGWAKKVNPKCSTHNFVKYWPILKILSLL